MSRVLLEAGMPNSPKFVSAPFGTLELWFRGLTYAASSKTDGFIPEQALAKVVAPDLHHRTLAVLVRHLTTVQPRCSNPSWHVVEGGYLIHDYDDPQFFNPGSKSTDRARINGSMGGQRSAEARRKKYGTAQPLISIPEATPEDPPSKPAEALPPPFPTNGISNNPPSPLTRRPLTAPTADQHVTALLEAWQGVVGRQITGADVRTAEEWVRDFSRATGEMLASWLQEAAEYRKGQKLEPLRQLALFRPAIRQRYDYVANDLPLRDPPNRGPDVGLVGIGAAATPPARAQEKASREVDPDDG
jgi:hypothetical protein